MSRCRVRRALVGALALSLLVPGGAHVGAQAHSSGATAAIAKGQKIVMATHSFNVFIGPNRRVAGDPGPLAKLADEAGKAGHETRAVQMIGGSTPMQHWTQGDGDESKNIAKAALRQGGVDVFTMSPNARMPEDGIDLFGDFVRVTNPEARILVQTSWSAWDGTGTTASVGGKGSPTFTNDDHDKAAIEQLRAWRSPDSRYRVALRTQLQSISSRAGRPVAFIVPSSDAVYTLREHIVRGEVPGITAQHEIFVDAMGHPRAPIANLVTYVWFAVMYRQSPIGLKALVDGADPTSAARETLLQQIAWNATVAEPLSGVTGAPVQVTVATAVQPVRIAGAPCDTPPALRCADGQCPGTVITNGGSVVEAKTGRTYFLDYPCDLKPDEKVTFILSLHGGGSYGNWQRHYFPLVDYVSAHRLVVATPFSPRRVWTAEDDAYLQNIVSSVVESLGRERIRAFWLAGHSQGGATSQRLVCTDFFKTRVDGVLSLSGGRIGGAAPRAANAGPPATAGTPAVRLPPRPATPPDTSCDFSHIYTTGEHEIASLPSASARAAMYECGVQTKQGEIVDARPGYVYDRGRQNPGTKQWGLLPRPGRANVFVYPNCKDGRVVADVVRLDKGHTEGLEPLVTEELVRLLVSARGGKIQQSGSEAIAK